MNIESKILYIKQSLDKLKALDKGYRVFGADSHRYLLNEVAKEEKIKVFENKYGIQLPEEY